MTSLFKCIVFVTVVIVLLSAGSVVVLYQVKPSETAIPENNNIGQVRVAVLNGCGREGLAAICARKLRSYGFDVVNGLGSNADSFDFDVSVVVDRKGNMGKALYCSEKTGIKEIIDQRSDDPYIIEDVVIVIGRDWDNLNILNEEDVD